jgi:hypothetical protein
MIKTLPVAIVTILATVYQLLKIDMPIELIEGAVTNVTNLIVLAGSAYIAVRNVYTKIKAKKDAE